MVGRRRGTFGTEVSKEKEIEDKDENMSHAMGAQV